MNASNPALGPTSAVLVALLASGAGLPGCGDAEDARWAQPGYVVVCEGSQPPAALDTAQQAQAVEQARTMIERAAGAPVPLYWTHLRAPGADQYAPPDRTRPGIETLVTIKLEAITGSARSFVSCGGVPMYIVPARLRATTEDGLIDAAFESTLDVPA